MLTKVMGQSNTSNVEFLSSVRIIYGVDIFFKMYDYALYVLPDIFKLLGKNF